MKRQKSIPPEVARVDGPPPNFSPSSIERVLCCPGSFLRAAKIPRTSSTYADEGKAAHLVAADSCWDHGEAKSGWAPGAQAEVDGESVTITDEMIRCGQEYGDEVRILRKRLGEHCRKFIEHKFVVNTTDPRLHGRVRGRADCVLDVPFGVLQVIDYKFGAGVMVDPSWNPQLCCYGLGAMTVSDGAPEEIRISVCQPRAPGEHWKTWTVGPQELLAWQRGVLEPGCVAALDPAARLCAGEHCRFCPVLPCCPEVVSQAKEAALMPRTPEVPAPKDVTLPNPELLTNSQLGRAYNLAKLIGSWVRAAEDELKRRVALGTTDTGYKLVAGVRRRHWRDEKAVERVLVGAIGDEAWEKSLLSVAKLEKLLGKDAAAALAGDYVETSASTALVPDADKRPALAGEAAAAFLAAGDEESSNG